jgi:hypothetical protein
MKIYVTFFCFVSLLIDTIENLGYIWITDDITISCFSHTTEALSLQTANNPNFISHPKRQPFPVRGQDLCQ